MKEGKRISCWPGLVPRQNPMIFTLPGGLVDPSFDGQFLCQQDDEVSGEEDAENIRWTKVWTVGTLLAPCDYGWVLCLSAINERTQKTKCAPSRDIVGGMRGSTHLPFEAKRCRDAIGHDVNANLRCVILVYKQRKFVLVGTYHYLEWCLLPSLPGHDCW